MIFLFCLYCKKQKNHYLVRNANKKIHLVKKWKNHCLVKRLIKETTLLTQTMKNYYIKLTNKN